MTASKVLEVFRSWIGTKKGTAGHRAIIDLYNSKTPLPMGYRVTYQDDWCDATVTAAFIKAGLDHLTGRECGVQRHIQIFKDKGIWLGKQKPKAGDIITFDWDGNGWGDHIGIVESISGDTVTTIEGNTFHGGVSLVERNTFKWNDRRIAGYARPKYGEEKMTAVNKTVDELAKEVIAGQHGSGVDRKLALGVMYDKVQERVNQLLKVKPDSSPIVLRYGNHTLTQEVLDKILAVCKHYDILPSYAITLLHYEGLWGNSAVGKSDNNWGGMTWNGQAKRPSGVTVSKGTARPANEGGHYMRYASVDDFLKDWGYLLRNGGSYRVSGAKSFETSVKGMFRFGGASYDYATMNLTDTDPQVSKKRFEAYLVGLASRKKSIEQVNGSLDKYDGLVVKTTKSDEIVVSKENVEVIINGVRYVPEK